MVAVQNALPQPIVFSLDKSECARVRVHLRKSTGFWRQIFSSTLIASIGIFTGIGYARTEGWHSAFASGVIYFWSVYLVLMPFRAFERCTVAPQSKTMLTFDQTGFTLESRGPRAHATRISCARVRSVRSTSETIGIYGAFRAYTTIPKAALPDGGAQVMRFFADRIVSQGLSESTSRGVTTLVNSVTPLFARG